MLWESSKNKLWVLRDIVKKRGEINAKYVKHKRYRDGA